MILFLYQLQLNELSYKDWHILKTLPEAGGKVACVSWNVHTQRDNGKSRKWYKWLIDGEFNDPSEWILFTGDKTIKDYNKQQSRSHRVNNIMIHRNYETTSKENNIGMACFSFRKTSFF